MKRNLLFALSVALLFAGVLLAQPPQPAEDPESVDQAGPITQSPSGPPAPAPPVPLGSPAAKYQIEKGLSMFAGIKDDAIFPWTDTGPRHLADAAADQMEERAYDEVLRHARQFSTAELEEHARRDLSLKDLFTNGRTSHKLELVYFEGSLRMLRKAEPTEILKQSGISELYEAWIFPGGIDPVCVFLTELPPGLSPQTSPNEQINRWVSVGGYFFKLLRYESNQISKTVKGEHQYRRAPVLMARSLTIREEPVSSGMVWRQTFLPLVVGGVGAVAFAILGLSWYFRKGDRAVQIEIEKNRTQNPFANGFGNS